MGKLFDYCMTGNWEETQRIDLYKKVGKAVQDGEISEAQLKKINKILNKK